MKPAVRLVVTDLDNTLYDWMSSFVPALYAMIDAAATVLDVPEATLVAEMRSVNQRHRNSEHPYALLELPSVEKALPQLTPEARKQALSAAFQAFNDVRRRTLRLYDGVRDTLVALRDMGIPVVAYTDARVQNALYRVAMLGLVDLLSGLYAPQHPIEPTRFEPIPEYAKAIPDTFVRPLPERDKKPNPATINDICNDFGVAPSHVVYVGDSLVRDVYMANLAGAHSAWARYGLSYDRALWDKLVLVTHWTESDVQRESALKATAGEVHAEVELGQFADILCAFAIDNGNPLSIDAAR